MKFNIVGLEENYGKHRFSNNAILNELAESSSYDESIDFVWWTEKVFLDTKFSDVADGLTTKPWFGVMHVPLLTPNWALYSQNNLAKLYFDSRWKKALNFCHGIIVLSEHMKKQLEALYPHLKVFYLKHPIGNGNYKFDVDTFKRSPQLLLVGAWLRDFDSFFRLKSSFNKKVLLNHYAEGYLRDVYSKYSIDILSKVRTMDTVSFVPNDEYDKLITSSLLFLGLHETSANNAVCECVSYASPFVSYKHPAIVEYVGNDYPLFIDKQEDLAQITVDDVIEGHKFLKANRKLREELELSNFIDGVKDVYQQIF